MDGCELRDALISRFDDDVNKFAELMSMSRRNAVNLVMGRYGVNGPLRILVRILDAHPDLVDEIGKPMKKQPSARQQLDNLEAALVEDILATPDEELLSEIRENGGDPEATAAQCQKIFEEVKEKTA